MHFLVLEKKNCRKAVHNLKTAYIYNLRLSVDYSVANKCLAKFKSYQKKKFPLWKCFTFTRLTPLCIFEMYAKSQDVTQILCPKHLQKDIKWSSDDFVNLHVRVCGGDVFTEGYPEKKANFSIGSSSNKGENGSHFSIFL